MNNFMRYTVGFAVGAVVMLVIVVVLDHRWVTIRVTPPNLHDAGVYWSDQAISGLFSTSDPVIGHLALGATTDRVPVHTEGDADVIRIDRQTGRVLAKCE